MSRQYGCYGDSQNECEVGPLNPNDHLTSNTNLRIKNLLPDCYLNLCNKRMINGSLDQTANYSPETQYFAYRNDKKSKFDDSIDNYLLLDGKEQTFLENSKIKLKKIQKNQVKFSVESMLENNFFFLIY